MSQLIPNGVCEFANTPAAGDVLLLGAPNGRRTFASVYADGDQTYYFISDQATQQEWGVGTIHLDAPPRLTRDTVIGNSSGTTGRLNFTDACVVFNDLPGERAIGASLDNLTIAMGGRRLTGLVDGTDPTDAATVEQLGAAGAAQSAAVAAEAAARQAADATAAGNVATAVAAEATARVAGDGAEATLRAQGDAANAALIAANLLAVQKALAGFATLSQFPYTDLENGILKLPGTAQGTFGIILQWGVANSTTGNNDVVNFNAPFPNHALATFVCEGRADGWGDPPNPTLYGCTPHDQSGFYLRCVQFVNGAYAYAQGVTAAWFAIGR